MNALQATTHSSQPVAVASLPQLRRLVLLSVALSVEGIAVAAMPHLGVSLHRLITPAIVFVAILGFLARNQLRRNLILSDLRLYKTSDRYALVHGLLVAVVLALWRLINRFGPGIRHIPTGATLLALWLAAIAGLFSTLVFTFVRPEGIRRLLGGLRKIWIYAACGAFLASFSQSILAAVWAAPDSRFGVALARYTLTMAGHVLALRFHPIVLDPATATLGTQRFQVTVAGGCSGIEGIALIVILITAWLIYARRELRVARAVCLLPLAVAAMWALNLARLAVLIAIGDAGYPGIAIGGFHSQAGWISFNLVGIGFLLIADRVRWFHRDRFDDVPATKSDARVEGDGSAAYLLPFLAILASSFVSRALSAGFEVLYPIRLAAALVVVFAYRKQYRALDLRFGLLGPALGLLVGFFWIGLNRLHPSSGEAIRLGLAAIPPFARCAWLAARVLAAVVTVPLAEELAFRGYLARRIASPNPLTLPYRKLSFFPILVSAAAFGAMHGSMWPAGVAAGVLFALAAKFRNRLGEAIAAHAVANLTLAVWVLAFRQYGLW